MNIIIFILILGVLIFVHELGHFLLAKWNNIRVDEFALGFPPTLWKKTKGETTYKLNAIPFGGYVKIFGENNEAVAEAPVTDRHRSFISKKWWQQISVLIAGIVFNIVFAWILFSATFMIGIPSIIDDTNRDFASDIEFSTIGIEPDSPAFDAGLLSGDRITLINNVAVTSFEQVQEAITVSNGNNLDIVVDRNDETEVFAIIPAYNDEYERYIIGAAFGDVGTVRYPIHQALWQGVTETITMTGVVADGLIGLIGNAFTGDANIKDLSGPVGIVGIIGDAKNLGYVYLLTLTAFISLNLAVLNLIPFPALDGGRILFVLIETITRKKIPANVAGWINIIGFGILMLLMIAVTISDIGKLI